MSNRAPKEVTKIFSAIEKSKRPKIIFPSSAIVCDNNRLPDYGMVEESCNIWEETILALQNDHFTPTKACACTIAGVIAITFIASSLTGNYSQVDKLWSVIPFVYCWILVADKRTLLMAVVATLWGIRLTWNFNRRGGYKWPVWDGDEDYRWKLLQDGALLDILRNNVAVSAVHVSWKKIRGCPHSWIFLPPSTYHSGLCSIFFSYPYTRICCSSSSRRPPWWLILSQSAVDCMYHSMDTTIWPRS